jgi:hypothetical protein
VVVPWMFFGPFLLMDRGFGWVLFSPSFDDWWLVGFWVKVGLRVDSGPFLVFFCFSCKTYVS